MEIYNPTADDLAALDRDLKFHPVDSQDLKFLTSEQVDFFNNSGYLMPFSGLGDTEVTELREYFDGVLAEVLARGDTSYSISSAHLKYRKIYELMSHPAILGPVVDILGEDVIAWGAHFFCKMPGDGKKVPWHQDCVYWPLSPSRTVTVWLAIDDASPENACMQFVPGTHQAGVYQFSISDDPDDVLKMSISERQFSGRDPVSVELKAGEFSIHSDLLMHGSDANESNRRRCGLTLRYAAAEVSAWHGWERKGFLVSGKDIRSHWANPGPPENP